MKIDFKSFFEGIISEGNQQKKIPVDSSLGVYFGISRNGYLRLSFLSKGIAPHMESTKFLQVTQGEESKGVYWTCFDLLANDSKLVFYSFCSNIVESVIGINDEFSALNALKKRYIAWKSLFKGLPSQGLSRETIQGLFGELYFMNHYIISNHGINTAITGWSGPEAKSKDFSFEDTWYEIKTVGANASTVHISSLAQLSSPFTGYLVVIKAEAMSSEFENGEACIKDLFDSILSQITDETIDNIFLSKICSYGFDLTDSCMKEKFCVKSLNRYRVDDQFPRITENDVTRSEICDVSYSLIIGALKPYLEE